MKIINLKEHPEAQENVLKETAILKHLNNPFIIKYFGKRTEESIGYIFLEYASGGELFDKIGNKIIHIIVLVFYKLVMCR